MAGLPFVLRRPWLLARDLVVDRRDPDLDALRRLGDPEAFLWAILPHAARTFSACIAMLPADSAKASAVGYLYCRMLDTYEDLVVEPAERDAALLAFAERFDGLGASAGVAPRPDRALLRGAGPLPPAPPLTARTVDARDRAHVLLVERCALVDRVFVTLEEPVQGIIADLVRDMARGMVWASGAFASQGGLLTSDEQLLRYCREVLGNPVVYVARLGQLRRTGRADLTPEDRERAMRSGEFIQLANVTRDIEKDLLRGVAYHPSLRGDLSADGEPVPGDEAARAERVRAARAHFLRLALERSPDYASFVQSFGGLMRASALLMLLFTHRHYRGTAARVGLSPWGQRTSSAGLLARTLPAMASAGWSRRHADRCVADMTAAADTLRARDGLSAAAT